MPLLRYATLRFLSFDIDISFSSPLIFAAFRFSIFFSLLMLMPLSYNAAHVASRCYASLSLFYADADACFFICHIAAVILLSPRHSYADAAIDAFHAAMPPFFFFFRRQIFFFPPFDAADAISALLLIRHAAADVVYCADAADIDAMPAPCHATPRCCFDLFFVCRCLFCRHHARLLP